MKHPRRLLASALAVALTLTAHGCSSPDAPHESLAEIAASANATTDTDYPLEFAADESQSALKATADLGEQTPSQFVDALSDITTRVTTVATDSDVNAGGDVTATIGGVPVTAAITNQDPMALQPLLDLPTGLSQVRFEHHMLIAEVDAEHKLPTAFDYISGLDSTTMRNYNITIGYPVDDATRYHTINHLGPETILTMPKAAEHLKAMHNVRADGLTYDALADVHVPEYDANRNTAHFDVTCNRAANRPTEHALIDGQELAEEYKASQGWQVRVTVRDTCITKDS